MIVSSFADQYGIRLESNDIVGMKWSEFYAMLQGISPDTALGRIVSIRAEEDKDILKHYTPEMIQIRRKWQEFFYEEVKDNKELIAERDKVIDMLVAALKS